MLRVTLAAAAGAVLVQSVQVLGGAPDPKGGMTPQEREVLSHMKVVYADDGQGQLVPTILIEGVNVQIVNGQGSMETTNGRGNLIVGYQVGTSLQRTGSHNFVVGDDHTYTSYGGIVSGESNVLYGPNSVALAGETNVARGERCTVIGGVENEVDGLDNVVIAGDNSSIELGAQRGVIISCWGGTIHDGDSNVIIGGQNNSIGGGSFNAVLTGGGHELLYSDYVGIVSGEDHDLWGAWFAALVGGTRNYVTDSFNFATFVGGSDNSVSDWYGTVVGGMGNRAQGQWSTAGGGLNRTAPGEFDWVAGGLFQDQ
jgi:hypothetical protein